jgi:hypothetical protein
MLGQELDVVFAVFERIVYTVLDEFLSEIHVVLDLVERHLRLYHPELREMTRSIRILRAESRAERIYASQGRGAEFSLKLTRHREAGHLAEEILRIIHIALLGAGKIAERKSRHLELRACSLAVGSRDQRRMEVIKAFVVKELMDGKGQRMADAKHGAESIGARAQMRFLTKEFESMAFFCKGYVAGSAVPYTSSSSACTSTVCPFPCEATSVPCTWILEPVVTDFSSSSLNFDRSKTI